MTKKIFTTGFVLLGLSNQVFGLGVTEILNTFGKGTLESFQSTSNPEKSTKETQVTKSNSLTGTSEVFGNTIKSFGSTTEWLVCANKCQKLLADQALVPAAKDYLVGVDVAAMDMEKLNEFFSVIREENPELSEKYPLDEQVQNEVFNKGLAIALVQGNFNNL